jgi:hypothetical protein
VTTALDESEAIGLTLAYEIELDRLAAAVARAVREAFMDLLHIDEADIEEFVREAKPLATAGAREAADLASGYIAELTGEALTPTELDLARVAYDSPFHRAWHQLKEGDLWEDARESGASVAEGIGYDATSDGAAQRMGKPGVQTTGWRRLVQADACEWCQVVATKLYRTQQSATFGHRHCRCKPIAVPRGNDPTHAINQARLSQLGESGAVQRATEANQRARRDAALLGKARRRYRY